MDFGTIIPKEKIIVSYPNYDSYSDYGKKIVELCVHRNIKNTSALARKIFEYRKNNGDHLYEEKKYKAEIDACVNNIRKTIDGQLKKERIGIEYIKEYCDVLNCSVDYIIGSIKYPTHEETNISEITGLNTQSIETLKFLNLNNGITVVGHNEIETLNMLLSNFTITITFLNGLQDFINARYKIPVYHTGKHNVVNGVFQPQCVIPDNEYDKIDENTYVLTLAKSKNDPNDNYAISLSDAFFESIALKTIEKSIIDLRSILKQKEVLKNGTD